MWGLASAARRRSGARARRRPNTRGSLSADGFVVSENLTIESKGFPEPL